MKKYIMMIGLMSLIGVNYGEASDAMTTSSLDSWNNFQKFTEYKKRINNLVINKAFPLWYNNRKLEDLKETPQFLSLIEKDKLAKKNKDEIKEIFEIFRVCLDDMVVFPPNTLKDEKGKPYLKKMKQEWKNITERKLFLQKLKNLLNDEKDLLIMNQKFSEKLEPSLSENKKLNSLVEQNGEKEIKLVSIY